jgi:hypothetical protein
MSIDEEIFIPLTTKLTAIRIPRRDSSKGSKETHCHLLVFLVDNNSSRRSLEEKVISSGSFVFECVIDKTESKRKNTTRGRFLYTSFHEGDQ